MIDRTTSYTIYCNENTHYFNSNIVRETSVNSCNIVNERCICGKYLYSLKWSDDER